MNCYVFSSDARFYYIPDGSATLTSAARQNLRIAEISIPPETRTPEHDDLCSIRSMNAETQTESVASVDQLTGTGIRQSSQSIEHSGSFPATLGDSGIQTSKDIVGDSSGPLCETSVEAVRSDNAQRRHQVLKRRSKDALASSDIRTTSKLEMSEMSAQRKSSVSDQVDVRNEMSDVQIVRLGSQPLREVTEILSNVAESLYHIQSTKKSTQSETNVLSSEESRSLTGVRRALSSLDSFLSLGTIESKPLFELCRAVSKLFKLYGMKFSRSKSTISTHSIAEANVDILNSDDVQVVLDMLQQGNLQRIASDLMRVCSSTESLSSTVTGDRLVVLLKQLETEDIHLKESDVLLDLIECLIDHLGESAPHQAVKKEYVDEFEDGMEKNGSRLVKDTFEGYGIFVLIQDTLHNIADELIRVADYIETDSTANSVDFEPNYLASSYSCSDTVATTSVSTKSKDSTDTVRQKDVSTQKPSNYQIEGPPNFSPAQNKPENGSSRLLSTLSKMTSAPDSNFGLGVGAKPKIPSAKKVKKDPSKITDPKPKTGSYSKKRNSVSKYNRTSGRHNREKVDYLSSSSSSTLTVCGKKSCDTCTSPSETRKGKSSRRKRHKQRVITSAKVLNESNEDVLESSRRAIMCCDKSSQKPPTPNVCIDKGTSLDFCREITTDKTISQGSIIPGSVAWDVDLDFVQRCVDEVINKIKTNVGESRTLGEQMDRNVRNIAPVQNDGSSVSGLANRTTHEYSNNLNETSDRRMKIEHVKSIEEIESDRDSKMVQSIQHLEEKSRILSLFIGKIIHGFFLQMNNDTGEGIVDKHVGPSQSGLKEEKQSNFRESNQQGIAKKEGVSSTSKLERTTETKSGEIRSMENVERKKSYSSPLVAQRVPNVSSKTSQIREYQSDTVPKSKISAERGTEDYNHGSLATVTQDQSNADLLYSSESRQTAKLQNTQTTSSTKSFLNTGLERFLFELIDSWRKISEKYRSEVISEVESLCECFDFLNIDRIRKYL